MLERLYSLFRGIVELHASLADFLGQLQRGAFIQCTLDSLMLARLSRQCPLHLQNLGHMQGLWRDSLTVSGLYLIGLHF